MQDPFFYPVKMAVLFSLSECSKGNIFAQTHLLLVASFIKIELICTLMLNTLIFFINGIYQS